MKSPLPPFFVNLVAEGEDRGITHWLGLGRLGFALCHHYYEGVIFQGGAKDSAEGELFNVINLSLSSNNEGGFEFD